MPRKKKRKRKPNLNWELKCVIYVAIKQSG